MQIAVTPALEDLQRAVARRNKRSFAVTALISLAIVSVAAILLMSTLSAVRDANRQLEQTQTKLLDTGNTLTELEQQLVAKKVALDSAAADIAKLQSEIERLRAELAEKSKELQEAVDLGQFTYQLDWGDAKSMYSYNPGAADALVAIVDLRGNTEWGMANTPEGGYNSPGFAQLVLSRIGRPGLAELPKDSGPPQPGDIVVYRSGYHLFYFEDQSHRPFVVGMTPFGVTALSYDFGVEKIAVLHTALNP